jgi:hypothetical protein
MNEKEQMDEINNINIKLNRILQILESDDKTNQKGLVEIAISNEVRIAKLEREREIVKKVNGAYGFVGAGIFGIVVWIVKLFANKMI